MESEEKFVLEMTRQLLPIIRDAVAEKISLISKDVEILRMTEGVSERVSHMESEILNLETHFNILDDYFKKH